jgi:hypothetical protein
MQAPLLERAIDDLALAGQQAGISVEDMIRVLRAGISVETLFDLIEWSLQDLTSQSQWREETCPKIPRCPAALLSATPADKHVQNAKGTP